MAWEIAWTSIHRHAELRLEAQAGAPLRFRLGAQRRTSRGALFIGAGEGWGLPVGALPLVTRSGAAVEASEVRAALPAHARSFEGEIIALTGELGEGDGEAGGAQRMPALWVSGLSELEAEAAARALELTPGVWVHPSEEVGELGGHSWAFPLYLVPLPRVVLRSEDRLADNTDAALSMGGLLEGFVQRFLDPESALPHVRIATGYLYQHGLRRVLGLLENPQIADLHLLFSGQTDRPSAEAITRAFCEQLDDALEDADDLWSQCAEAAASGRLQVRVYTRAFLHAKLFLGWERADRDGFLASGIAVLGSSNVTAPGMQASGNLELNATLEERHQLRALERWFQARWEEADLPEPALMEILQSRRPGAPPEFETPGLLEVWEAGRRGRLQPPGLHLSLLGSLYGEEAARLPQVNLPPWSDLGAMTITPAPEQDDGVLALVQRLLSVRVAFLADSVGLGKTITALGAAWYLRRMGASERAALISPRKLFGQWQAELRVIGAPEGLVSLVSRHALERASEEQALRELEGVDLILVEEAHEALRNRKNRLWTHLRAYLKRNPAARLLLISATPWNNRREDIFAYLLLAWADYGDLMRAYPALQADPPRSQSAAFMCKPTEASAVRSFELLPLATYRRIFSLAFVQRTRASVEHRYGRELDFPQRLIHPESAAPSAPHAAFFAALAEALEQLHLPHYQLQWSLLRAAAVVGVLPEGDVPPNNLLRTLVVHLYKRAESSLLALAISLRNLARSLEQLRAALGSLLAGPHLRSRFEGWLQARQSTRDPEEALLLADQGELELSEEDAAEVELPLAPLLRRLDDAQLAAVLQEVMEGQLQPDLERIAALRALLTLDLDRSEPKSLHLLREAQRHFRGGHKPLLIASYADTATRAFIALCRWLPEACVALALGGDEAWIYLPGRHRAAPLSDAEWEAAQAERDPSTRRVQLLGGDAGVARAQRLPRADALALFAPRAQHTHTTQAALFEQLREVDILVGSEAISVGQNLQDATALLHLDLPWNPMILEQRIGRIDRRGGGRAEPGLERRVVDLHYCWSLEVIEHEVSLRRRLQEKTRGALRDTDFDELLLFEVQDAIEEARARNRDAPVEAAQEGLRRVLGQRQAALAEEQGRVPGVEPAPSHMDGLRALQEACPAPLPASAPEVIACAARFAAPWRWTLTLQLEALSPQGEVLHRELLHDATSDHVPEPPPSNLAAAVDALRRAAAWPASRPGDRGGWTLAVQALDRRLQGWAAQLLTRHNAEVDAALARSLQPAAQRDPSEQLRRFLMESSVRLTTMLTELGKRPTSRPFVERERERLRFLYGCLQPARLPDLLITARSEADLSRALLELKLMDAADLEGRFPELFQNICGVLWAQAPGEAAAGPAQQTLTLTEQRWAQVRLSVRAATWRD